MCTTLFLEPNVRWERRETKVFFFESLVESKINNYLSRDRGGIYSLEKVLRAIVCPFFTFNAQFLIVYNLTGGT
jgi:hypothetical protein